MILEVRDLCYSYGKRSALEDVSLAVERSGVTCLMGPNGSGKTTLLECMLGVRTPRAGEALLLGRPLSGLRRSEIARHIAFIPQNHTPHFPYTVREMVLLGRLAYASPFGAPGREDEKACERAMELAGVAQLAGQPYSALSGGELRLVLLARALCQRAEILLLDEPAAHLDFRNELLLLERLAALAEAGEVTVVMATHAPNHAFFFESRGLPVTAALLDAGRLDSAGSPSEVITPAAAARVFGVEAEVADVGGTKTLVVRHPLERKP